MKKALFILLIGLGALNTSWAQKDYNTALGLRGGSGNGVTVKHFISDKNALEGILFTRWGGFNLTGLYEVHKGFPGANGLNWYYGPGAHIGNWVDNGRNPWFKNNDEKRYFVIGADFILGIEYNFKEIPINISADWKPAFNLIGNSGFWGDNGGLSIRYLFR